MTEETLAAALEREHREIDDGVAGFVAGLEAGEIRAEPITRAMDALRRHIYLEEAFLFPPIRSGCLAAAVLVMYHEHGRMWRLMDELSEAVARGDDPATIREHCRKLVEALGAHNMKEEAVIYPEVDGSLAPEEAAGLRRFFATGTVPEGWACRFAAPR